MRTSLSFAPHVGTVLGAARMDGGLLCLGVAAGKRGAHHVIVLDPKKNFAEVSSTSLRLQSRRAPRALGHVGNVVRTDVENGRIVGQVVLSSAAGGCTATDGVSFDWAPQPKSNARFSTEIEARLDGVRLSGEELELRRRPGLLRDLI